MSTAELTAILLVILLGGIAAIIALQVDMYRMIRDNRRDLQKMKSRLKDRHTKETR